VFLLLLAVWGVRCGVGGKGEVKKVAVEEKRGEERRANELLFV